MNKELEWIQGLETLLFKWRKKQKDIREIHALLASIRWNKLLLRREVLGLVEDKANLQEADLLE